jgi:hypothetical protein
MSALTKVASAYSQAAHNIAAEKVASLYGPDVPHHYKEALILMEKEALLSQIGGSVIRGAGKAVGKVMPHLSEGTGAAVRKNFDKGVGWAAKNQRLVGGAAVGAGAAAAGGAGYLGGRLHAGA